MAVRVVTDSTAHLSPDLVQELDIVVVPFHVEVDGQAYLDGVDLDEDTFCRLVYQEGHTSTTSSPTVEEFYRVFQDLNRETGEIIVIPLSATLSKAHEHARRIEFSSPPPLWPKPISSRNTLCKARSFDSEPANCV